MTEILKEVTNQSFRGLTATVTRNDKAITVKYQKDGHPFKVDSFSLNTNENEIIEKVSKWAEGLMPLNEVPQNSELQNVI